MDEPERPSSTQDLPSEASFASLLLLLSSTALFHLGEVPDPSSGEKRRELSRARWVIDLLALLKEKTRGNLTGEEEELLDQLLYDLRMRYLKAAGQIRFG